jgi:asparagine synthetase B (glutamine-hydrolysing)
MLESVLRIENFCWSHGAFLSPSRPDRIVEAAEAGASLQGRFACATATSERGVTLTRDRLGLNKLFVAVHESGRVTAASYLIDLVTRKIPFEAIYSVPAGHVVELNRRGAVAGLYHYAPRAPRAKPNDVVIDDVARDLRRGLDVWFSRLAAQFSERRVCVCLSGGIDSSIIAALAKKYFSDVTAYTYTFGTAAFAMSEDAQYADWVAKALRIPFRLVQADTESVLLAIENAVCYGQDWRDFNVHCAIVNDILARAIRHDASADGGRRPLILTGDLANEFLADYTSVPYDGKEYYRLPALPPADLRRALIRGLDVGDREVGIFNHYGIDVIQPYSFVVDQYFQLPGTAIGDPHFKQAFAKQVAGDLVPGFIFDRVKVRAQMGSSVEAPGILPVLIQTGYDTARLRSVFCRIFRIENPAALNRFVRAGRYRTINHGSGKRPVIINGYLAA